MFVEAIGIVDQGTENKLSKNIKKISRFFKYHFSRRVWLDTSLMNVQSTGLHAFRG